MAFWRKKKNNDSGNSSSQSDTPEINVGEPNVGGDGNPSAKKGVFALVKSALSKTNQALRTDIRDLWKSEGRLVDDDFLRELYGVLVKSDMGPSAATQIRDRIRSDFRGRKVEISEVLDVIRGEIQSKLSSAPTTVNINADGPTIILFVGVNGSGKTTSIAKLAHRFHSEGKRVLLAAGDTFRAAAVSQLKIWSERIGCDIVLGEQGGDPGTVAYKAAAKAAEENYDVCIVDTAGRLQTQSNLMQQLDKIRRVVGKHVESAPHEVLLVLDATAGQNAISQARGFSEASGCTGIVLSKLDGSAKGGVILPVLEEFDLPVKFVGLGEQMTDLADFNPEDFANALFDFE